MSLHFDRAPAELLGKRGEGFKQMLLLMNNARIGVGFESLGLMEAAHRAAAEYASVRRSMGKTIDRHEMIADYLEEMQTEIQVLRAMCMKAAWHEELAQKLEIALTHVPGAIDDDPDELKKQLRYHKRRSRRLTPLVKWFGSERAVAQSRNALQIHGGYGYIKDYVVEKLVRDALVFPIYEGTSQIQALMAMKDHLVDAVRHPARVAREQAADEWKRRFGESSRERGVATLRCYVHQATRHLIARLAGKKIRALKNEPVSAWGQAMSTWDPKHDFSLAMLHAERLIELLTHAESAQLLFEQTESDPDRGELLDRWLERALPRSRYRLDQIQSTGPRLLATLTGRRSEVPRDEARAAAK